MKIAHVLRRLSFDDWGGTEQVVWNLANAQLAAGHDVRLFATTALYAGRDGPAPQDYSRGAGALPPAISRFHPIYPWFPMPKRLVAELDRKGGNPFVPGLGRALREWRPDVIHCHAMARIAELCLRTAKATGAKCAISLHGGGAGVPEAEAKSLKAPTRGLLPWGKAIDILMGWTRRIPEDADGIVCVGEDEYDLYRARHPHVLFLPNGVDTALYQCRVNADSGLDRGLEPAPSEGGRGKTDAPQSATRPVGEALQASSGRPPALRAVCVARIDRQKNQMLLVEALARNPALTVRLVGPVTQPDYRAELEARAAELGVADRLSFAGALKPGSPELVAEYHAADVFVLPSRHEPFGIVVLEAWAAGLPVVASDVGGLGRLCAAHPGAALVFPPGDGVALDAALARLASDPALRASLSQAGFKAAAKYDWHLLSDRLVRFYGEM